MTECAFDECGNDARALGLCKSHHRQQRLGRPLRALRAVDPVARFWARVDKTGECWLWTGPDANGSGYGKARIDGVLVYVHRYSYELANGDIPTGFEIDHACRSRMCVNPAHLRLATHKQNSENHGPRADNTTGARGVTRDAHSGRFRGQVTHHGTTHSAGVWDTEAEASLAVAELRRSLFTHSTEDAA